MKKLTIVSILAAGVLAVPALSAWDQVINFEQFEVQATKDPASALANFWHVTRDEGYEAGRTEGFGVLEIDETPDGHTIFSHHTGGFGYSWGHNFGGVNLPEPITEQGTFYFQVMVEGASLDWNWSLAPDVYERVDPPLETNPWGWAGGRDWGDMRATVRNDAGAIGIRDGGAFNRGEYNWVPGAWYEMWMTVDVPSELYTVWLHSPDAGISEQSPIIITFEGEEFEDYYFRSGADHLASVLMGQTAGSPGAPTLGHRWWLNAMAFDVNAHNLTNPGVDLPGFTQPPVLIYGFTALAGTTFEEMRVNAFNFLGSDVWFGAAPYIYSFDIAKWMWMQRLWIPPTVNEEGEETAPGRPRDPETENLAARAAEWVYIWESPFAADTWTGSAELGTWVWGTESGWAYIINSLR